MPPRLALTTSTAATTPLTSPEALLSHAANNDAPQYPPSSISSVCMQCESLDEASALPSRLLRLAPRVLSKTGGVPSPLSSPARTDNSSSPHSSFKTSVLVPILVVVALLMLFTAVLVKILPRVRRHYAMSAYRPPARPAPLPEKSRPRLSEVNLHDVRAPSMVGKWAELMPVTVEEVADENNADLRSSRRTSVASSLTYVPSDRSPSRDSRSSRLSESCAEKLSALSMLEEGHRVRVACLIAMPSESSPARGQGAIPPESCIGLVDASY